VTDHDPLASALVAAMTSTDYYSTDRKDLWDAATDLLRQRLDAAGYEVRPKLTAERLAAALHPHYGPGLCLSQDQHEWPGCDRKDEWYSDAAAILAIIDGEAT